MDIVWFISGVIFALVVLPFMHSLAELIVAWMETYRMQCAEAINHSNINMQKAVASAEEVPDPHPIGFRLSEEEEECEDDEDF